MGMQHKRADIVIVHVYEVTRKVKLSYQEADDRARADPATLLKIHCSGVTCKAGSIPGE